MGDMVPKNPKPSTPQKTVALPAHELSKLDRPALGGLLSLSLETFTRRRVEALFESADPAAAAEALARIDADEAERRRAESVEAQFSKLLRPKTRYPLLDPAFVSEYRRELVVTARAIGAYQLSEGHEPHAEHDRSYRFWMGNKLNLSREETEAADLEAVELRFSEKLDAARKHVTDRLLSVPPEIREFFKSAQYFDDLHTVGEERLSPRRLFSLFVEFEHAREAFARHKNHPDAIGELKKAQYEIQRLFALADLYRDYEQTPEYQNLTLDAEFLERKVSSLFERSASADDEVGLPSIRHIRPNNVLYAHTVSKRTYWKNENGTYVFSESPAPGAIPMKLESATFV